MRIAIRVDGNVSRRAGSQLSQKACPKTSPRISASMSRILGGNLSRTATDLAEIVVHAGYFGDVRLGARTTLYAMPSSITPVGNSLTQSLRPRVS